MPNRSNTKTAKRLLGFAEATSAIQIQRVSRRLGKQENGRRQNSFSFSNK
jgi:hypothetical protein